jgi:hypothetical protein
VSCNKAKDGEAATAAVKAGIPHPTTVTFPFFALIQYLYFANLSKLYF